MSGCSEGDVFPIVSVIFHFDNLKCFGIIKTFDRAVKHHSLFREDLERKVVLRGILECRIRQVFIFRPDGNIVAFSDTIAVNYNLYLQTPYYLVVVEVRHNKGSLWEFIIFVENNLYGLIRCERAVHYMTVVIVLIEVRRDNVSMIDAVDKVFAFKCNIVVNSTHLEMDCVLHSNRENIKTISGELIIPDIDDAEAEHFVVRDYVLCSGNRSFPYPLFSNNIIRACTKLKGHILIVLIEHLVEDQSQSVSGRDVYITGTFDRKIGSGNNHD